MKIKYLCGLMFLGLFSCISNKESENVSNVIEIDLEGGSTCSVKPDSITELQIIPLEDKQEAMVSMPSKLKVTNKGFLILDSYSGGEKVLLFDKSGNFINKVGSRGHGHGEYSEIKDVGINENGETILLINSVNSLLVYDSNGDYIKTVNNVVEQKINDTYVERIRCCADCYVISTKMNAYCFDKYLKNVKCIIDGNVENDINVCNYPEIYDPNRSESNVFYRYSMYNSRLDVVNFNDTTLNKHYVFKSKNVATHEKVTAPSMISRYNFDYLDENYYVADGIIKSYFFFYNPQTGKFNTKSFYFNSKTGKFAFSDDYDTFVFVQDYYEQYYYKVISVSDLLGIVNHGKIRPENSRKQMYYDAYKALDRELTPENNHVIIKFKLADNEEIPL